MKKYEFEVDDSNPIGKAYVKIFNQLLEQLKSKKLLKELIK